MSWAIFIAAWIGAVAWPAMLLFLLWRGLKSGRGPQAVGWSVIVLICGLWGIGVRAFLWEPETVVVRRVDVDSRTRKGPPLRIGVIADTHMSAPHQSVARLKSIVRQMNSLHPDIVVLLGDFAGGHTPAAQ